ncbi:MAG: RAMP superfamily CRISPR-associated protein [Candidatus Bathyarchaeia archaeon]
MADNAFITTKNNKGNEIKLIPSSTIKGVLRSSMIRIAYALGFNDVIPSIHPEKIGKAKDIVVSIFGKPGEDFSKIKIENAYYDGDTQTLAHVRINDKRGVAEEGGLFTIEYIPIGEKFLTKMVCNHLSIEEVRALFGALANLRYERIGRGSLVNVKIVRILPKKVEEEFKKDDVVKLLLDALINKDEGDIF